MKKFAFILTIVIVCFFLGIYLAYAQNQETAQGSSSESIDVNNDGAADVVLHNDGKYITKAEADTANDGKPDIIVHAKDGNFESAEVDTDNNGTMDRTFTNAAEFNDYINATNPAYKDALVRGSGEWAVATVRF